MNRVCIACAQHKPYTRRAEAAKAAHLWASGCTPMDPGGKRGTYWRGGKAPREGPWRAARCSLPPPAVAEPALDCGLRANAPHNARDWSQGLGRPRLRVGPCPPAAAPWEGAGGDGHLRWLVGRLRATSWLQA